MMRPSWLATTSRTERCEAVSRSSTGSGFRATWPSGCGGSGPLYCSFDHADGTPIGWDELVEQGSLIYGGVGESRYMLDYDDPEAMPFRNIFREPGAFEFFYPTEEDLALPDGILFNSGRSSLSDDRGRIHFATSTFNSGKATPVVTIPDEHPLYVSPYLAERTGLETGDTAKVTSSTNGNSS